MIKELPIRTQIEGPRPGEPARLVAAPPRESPPEMTLHDVRFEYDRRIRMGLEVTATQWLWLAGDRQMVPGVALLVASREYFGFLPQLLGGR